MPRQLFLAANYQENGTEFSLLFRNFAHLFEQNRGTKMLTEKFFEVIRNEGVVSIVSWGHAEPHLTCTWNSYLVVTDDGRILIPAAGMKKTEANVEVNNRVLLALGTRNVEGFNGYQGTGFRIEGRAKFLTTGPDYEMMHQKYPFIRSVLEVTVDVAKQML